MNAFLHDAVCIYWTSSKEGERSSFVAVVYSEFECLLWSREALVLPEMLRLPPGLP